VESIFEIGLHQKDLPLLLAIQSYFKGIGTVVVDSKTKMAFFKVRSTKDLLDVIIPHFNTYPLLTKKRIDFILWCRVVNIMETGGHLTLEGLLEILSIKSLSNKGLTQKLTTAFSNIKPCVLPEVEHLAIYDPY